MGLRHWLDSIEPLFLKGGQVREVLRRLRDGRHAPLHAKDGHPVRAPCPRQPRSEADHDLRGPGHDSLRSLGFVEHRVSGQHRPRPSWAWKAPAAGAVGSRRPSGSATIRPILLACFIHGFLYFFPIYVVTLAAGGPVRGRLCRDTRARGERGLLRHLDSLCPDPAGDDAALAGGAGHHLRRGDRQGDLRRHGQEHPQPGADRAGLSLLRLPGPDVRRCRLGAGRRLQRRHRAQCVGRPRATRRCRPPSI